MDDTLRTQPRRGRVLLWFALPVAAMTAVAAAWVVFSSSDAERQTDRQVVSGAEPTPPTELAATAPADRSAEDACRKVNRDDRLIMPQDWGDEDRVLAWAEGWFAVASSARFADDRRMSEAGAEIHDTMKATDGDLNVAVDLLTGDDSGGEIEPPWMWIALSCVEADRIEMDRFLELSGV